MKWIGLYINNKCVKILTDVDGKEAMLLAKDLTEKTGQRHICLPIQFNDLPEADKLNYLTTKSKEHEEFISSIKETGRTYSSNISLTKDEYNWLLTKAIQSNK